MDRFRVCSFPSCMEHPSYPRHCLSYHRISIWLRRLVILGVVRLVQLLDMVDKSIPFCKPTSGRFFRHGADRGSQLLLERGSIRLLLQSLSPPTPHHDTATAPGCRRLKRKPESRGKKAPRTPSIVGSFSPQPWLESAGDSVAPDVCPLVLEAAQASSAAIHGGAQSDSTLATCQVPI